jgi:hypothetical protein
MQASEPRLPAAPPPCAGVFQAAFALAYLF